MKFETFIGIAAGAVLGVVTHRLIGMTGWDMDLGFGLSGRDAIVFAIGLILIFFGGRIASFAKNIGYGMFAWQLGHELTHFIW